MRLVRNSADEMGISTFVHASYEEADRQQTDPWFCLWFQMLSEETNGYIACRPLMGLVHFLYNTRVCIVGKG
jgi:hypothetical protein